MDTERLITWLKKAPLSDDMAEEAPSDFSYDRWFEEGRAIPDGVATLVALLEKENFSKPSEDAFRIIYALGWIGDNRATNVLLSALRSSDARVRTEAAAALGQLHADQAFAPLRTLLEDKAEDTNVRANACIALGRLAQPESEVLLQEASKESDTFVAQCAEEGLRLLQQKA
jgi:HEAT repeat protein